MKKLWIVSLVLAFALAVAIVIYLQPTTVARSYNPLAQLINNKVEGFARVKPDWQYVFPRDNGAHPEYQIDAWYFTGYLSDAKDRRFGFQMTFFRFALAPNINLNNPAWSSNDIYRAHLAITDVDAGQFYTSERFSRAALGAGAEQSPVQVWLDDWEMRMPAQTQSQFQLLAVTEEINLMLNLEIIKQAITNVGTGSGTPLFHGYWLPRLRVSGTLGSGDDPVTVNGIATLTHVWGGMSLFRGQLALNRFVLQLDDQREILLLQLRRRDGSAEPITSGLLIEVDGTTRRLSRQDLNLSVVDYWQSNEEDSVRYPNHWRLQIPSKNLQLEITPMLENQELNLSLRYWAGLVQISGKSAAESVGGTGQVELTAYAADTAQQ